MQRLGRSKEYDNGVHAMTPPCKECTDRELGCHGRCERYAAFREEREELIKRRAAMNDTIRNEAIHKTIKCIAKKNKRHLT